MLDAFDAEVQHRLERSVWAGCTSWYRTATGRITTNWPGLPSEYVRRARFDLADYRVGTQGVAPEPAGRAGVSTDGPVSTPASGRGSGHGAQRPSTSA